MSLGPRGLEALTPDHFMLQSGSHLSGNEQYVFFSQPNNPWRRIHLHSRWPGAGRVQGAGAGSA